ncbi:MAG: hypothetical protein HYX73_01520 [Acidobacteria bacterium]|nr:hypothetical protein [Acidobacteriota bacterium]
MKRILQNPFAIWIAITMSAIAVGAQQQASPSPAATKIEGTITTALNAGCCGLPAFTLKTEEGKEYAIHLGTLMNTAGQAFTPKIGETIVVTGALCCGMPGQNMIHAAEIALGQETFRAPTGSMPSMMPGMMPGMGMGPGMMMGPGPMGPGQPGQGMMGCPGMTGQMMPVQGQTGPGTMAPGAMSCCGGTVVGAACPGCILQQPTAPASEPGETK